MAPTLSLALDLAGIFVFGLSGGLLAVHRRMDVFGVIVLALAAALGGGALRDVLLGDLPPEALRSAAPLLAGLGAAAVSFFFHRYLDRLGSAVRLFDAMGLGLFCVAGAVKGVSFGVGPLQATLLGVMTGVGGGALRDLLANQVPLVLEREIYALAALVGAAGVVALLAAGVPASAAMLPAAATATGLRIVAMRRGWHAPRAPGT